MHLNIHSLKNKVDGLEVFLDKERPDIVCLTEHHVGDQERKTVHFENFNEGSIYCRATKSKGGTAIYVNKGITSREINVSDLAFEGDIELCVVKCDEVKVTVACVYRPPSGNYKVFFSNFEKLLERICRADATVFVCGDFNINLLEENDKQVKRYGERLTRLLGLNNLNIAIDTPTRVAKGSATLIDNIFTSQNKDFFSACNKDPGLSDHFSQFLYTQVHQETDCSKPGRIKHLYKRVHTDESIILFKSFLQTYDWNSMFLEGNTIDEWYNGFVGKVKGFYEMAFPVKRLKQKKMPKEN